MSRESCSAGDRGGPREALIERRNAQGRVPGDGFGPLLGEHERRYQVADLVFIADFEEIEAYAIDTLHVWFPNDFDPHGAQSVVV